MPGTELQTVGRQVLGYSLIGLKIYRFAKIANFIAGHMLVRDRGAAQEIVDLARADVSQDTGRLFNGINWWPQDDAFIVQAAAVHEDRSGGEDYAGFVEHGTQSGERGRKVTYAVADSGYHEATSGLGDGSIRSAPRSRSRLQYRDHPGTNAQPFFYKNAHDVLARRGADAEDVIGLALDEDDNG